MAPKAMNVKDVSITVKTKVELADAIATEHGMEESGCSKTMEILMIFMTVEVEKTGKFTFPDS